MFNSTVVNFVYFSLFIVPFFINYNIKFGGI